MTVAFAKEHLQTLIDALWEEGFEVVGPTLGEGAIVYAPVKELSQLPRGWVEEQEGGSYRLCRDPEERYFAFTLGPQSWKKYLHPPRLCLWKAKKDGDGFTVESQDPVTRRAFLGVRACELAAIGVQDRVFLEQEHSDPWYQRRREAIFMIGVQCARAGGTCFCASMQTGPAIKQGDDLTLTELDDVFLAQARTSRAQRLLDTLPTQPATEQQSLQATRQTERAVQQMGRSLDTEGLPELLQRNLTHPRWSQVAERCLSCSNCTMVCPTCFCFTVDDVTDLTGLESRRERSWDSCFTSEFTLTSGSCHRQSTKSRYRQWMTHKLSTWHDQFGESGCVGCGRCITWCPVGIDITEEAAAIAATDGETDE